MAGTGPLHPKRSRILAHHYRLGPLLGSGAMGAVYQATDRRDGGTVAVKLLHSQFAKDQSFLERFEREAHVGALLRSPYTVHLLDYGADREDYFIVMEYIDGRTLTDVLASGSLPLNRALRVAVQVAHALEEAEARGIVHRDIKPDNIMVRANDSVKVTDFGIARQVAGGTLTMPGAFIGTLSYAAPEQFAARADHRSDIYSLGATLYHMLAGRPPFAGSLEQLLRSVRETAPDFDALRGLPRDVIVIVKRCLEKEPKKRFQSASELAVAIQDASRGQTTATVEAPTLVVETPPAVVEPPPTEVLRKPEEEPAPRAAVLSTVLSMELGPERKGFWSIGGRLASSRYALRLLNAGDRAVDVHLDARDETKRCLVSVPGRTLSVPARGSVKITMKVRPRRRRWRGAPQMCEIAVTASGGDEPPPAAASGRFEDVPYGWLPYGAGLVPCVAAAVVLAAVFLPSEGEQGRAAVGASPTEQAPPRITSPPVPEPAADPLRHEFSTAWGQQGSDDGQFQLPLDVAIDDEGNVYIADVDNHRIQKFTSDGAFISKWGSNGTSDGQFQRPNDLAVDAAGNVYVADGRNNRIQVFTAGGTYLRQWGSEGAAPGAFGRPIGVALDSDGNVYVADLGNHRVQKFMSNGVFVTEWGGEGNGDGQFLAPSGMATDGAGHIYVADIDANRIQKFTTDGVYLSQWGRQGGGDGEFEGPLGVALDSDGYVYVTDSRNHRVQRFTSDGDYIDQFGASGSEPGQFLSPAGIALDGQDSIYVTDSGNHRVVKYTPVTPGFPRASPTP